MMEVKDVNAGPVSFFLQYHWFVTFLGFHTDCPTSYFFFLFLFLYLLLSGRLFEHTVYMNYKGFILTVPLPEGGILEESPFVSQTDVTSVTQNLRPKQQERHRENDWIFTFQLCEENLKWNQIKQSRHTQKPPFKMVWICTYCTNTHRRNLLDKLREQREAACCLWVVQDEQTVQINKLKAELEFLKRGRWCQFYSSPPVFLSVLFPVTHTSTSVLCKTGGSPVWSQRAWMCSCVLYELL